MTAFLKRMILYFAETTHLYKLNFLVVEVYLVPYNSHMKVENFDAGLLPRKVVNFRKPVYTYKCMLGLNDKVSKHLEEIISLPISQSSILPSVKSGL